MRIDPRPSLFERLRGGYERRGDASRVDNPAPAGDGRIVCQIWHCGRVAHPDVRGGELPVGPSPIPAPGKFFLPGGEVDFPTPRELATEEIAPILEGFAAATRNVRDAGFDGVELHGANGYLQDQFLEDGSNQRRDCRRPRASNDRNPRSNDRRLG